jgi:hypothetical protein
MHSRHHAAPSMSERMLVDTIHRLCRTPIGRVAVVLHLSRLRPPAPRAHHRRVARALLQDAAQRHDGQVFVLRNGDQVLICAAGRPVSSRRGWHDHKPAGGATRLEPRDLPAMLVRLMQIDAPDPARLASVFNLPAEQDGLIAYAEARLEETVLPASVDEEGFGPADIAAGLDDTRMRRQTGVMVSLKARSGFRPVYTETDHALPVGAVRDPFLLRHLAGAVDRGMLHQGVARPKLHLNLSLAGPSMAEFAAVAQRCRAEGTGLAVEITLLEACADPDKFTRLRRGLHLAGIEVGLDGISHLALAISAPAVLGADFYKLDWSPRLPGLAVHERADLAASLAAIGLDRVVLNGADEEQAMRWGLGQGIRRFQGRHVDIILAAERMMVCPHAEGCTLTQCADRARATDPAGRRGCLNVGLLDGGVAFVTLPPSVRAA